MWQYESNGIYSTQSLYAVINFRGVQPVFVPAVWNIKVPPKIQVFLWLLSNNKLMTVDNLAKRGVDKPKNCRFCDEIETINHLFFQCVVARKIWAYFEQFINIHVGSYTDMATKWLDSKKFCTANSLSAGVCWGLWLARNNMVFRDQQWRDIKQVLKIIWSCTRMWEPIFREPEHLKVSTDAWCAFLEGVLAAPLEIGHT